jgi:hypothetical protein
MTTEQARATFQAAIDASTDPAEIAKLELAREYFTNPDFRKALEDKLFNDAMSK